MESSNLKNMVVLKNLPSNIIEEAIIILKKSKQVKKLQKIDQNKNTFGKEKDKKEKDYIIKEAEMLINSYVVKIEDKEEKIKNEKMVGKKYNKLKKYARISTIICIIETILLIFL